MLLTTGSIGDTLKTYRAIFRGAGLNWFFDVGSHSIGLPFSDARVWFPWNTDDITSQAASNLEQTLLLWTALVLTGLAVAFAFRCGLFNIGGNGQYLSGSIAAVLIATELPKVVNLPGLLLIIVSIVGAMLAGAALAGIAGLLKGTVGAHEVITTIMLNWIVVWVGVVPLRRRRSAADESRRRGRRRSVVGGRSGQGAPAHVLGRSAAAGTAHRLLHLARGARRLLARAQPDDARLRGARRRPQPRGGALRRHQRPAQLLPRDGDRRAFAGLAGGLDLLGWQYRVDITTIQGANIGFIGIAVALLGRNTAVGVGLSALLFAALQTGTASRNLDPTIFAPGVGSSLAVIIQGLVVLFVGADVLILIMLGWFRRGRRKGARPDGDPVGIALARLRGDRHRRLRGARRAAAGRRAQPGPSDRDRPAGGRARPRVLAHSRRAADRRLRDRGGHRRVS